MFKMHMLNSVGKEQMQLFKMYFADAVRNALDRMPEGIEKSIFITKVEEAVFFGAKAIAGKEGNFDSVQSF